jgi:NAD(P)-dependent dehydrogenase (short-subunit alcohol dehydrogenase family)
MNICVIGGGSKEGRFGRDFCDRARSDGHDVYVLSHRPSAENNSRHTWADFDSVDAVVAAFKQLTADLAHIDIFVYNSKPTSEFPGQPEHFVYKRQSVTALWHKTIDGHAVLPHLLSMAALKKMSDRSKLVFLVSGLATNFDRDYYTHCVGYATGKAAQAFLMLAFAHHNDRGAIATAVSPHFDNPDTYKNVFDGVYRYILNMDHEQNGKIENFHR